MVLGIIEIMLKIMACQDMFVYILQVVKAIKQNQSSENITQKIVWVEEQVREYQHYLLIKEHVFINELRVAIQEIH